MQRLYNPRSITIASAGLGMAAYATSHYLQNTERLDDGSPKRTFTGQLGFQSLTLESVEQVNHNVKRLRFALPDRDAVSGLTLNSALLSYSWPSTSYLPVLRPYSPITLPSTTGHVDLLVKRYEQGKQSTHLHSLSPGDKCSFRGPLVHYNWTPNAYPHIALIAGGAGITPCYQLIKGILSNPEEKTKVTLVFGNQSRDDVILKGELDELEKRWKGEGRFRVVYAVGKDEGDGERTRKGRITRELLGEVLPKECSEGDAKIFVCGPPGMEEAVAGKKGFLGFGAKEGILGELGYGREKIHKF